jgi:hypothetical protein
MTGLDAAL